MWGMINSSAKIYATFVIQSFSRLPEDNNISMECTRVRYDFKRNTNTAQSLSRMPFNWWPGRLEQSVPLDGMFGKQTMVHDSRLEIDNKGANDVTGWRSLCVFSREEAVVFCFYSIDLHSAGIQRDRTARWKEKSFSRRE
jgi:hypothetical protein